MALTAASIGALVCTPAALADPPANDLFANAQPLPGESGTAAGTNVEATKETGEPIHAGNSGGASVWFSWTAPRSGVLVLDTCGSSFDTLLAVYTGQTVNALTLAGASDDDAVCGPQSGTELNVAAGIQYRIAVDGKNGVTGAMELFYGMVPSNDNLSSAGAISGSGGQVSGTTFLASHEPGEPFHAGEPGTGSVWYEWTSPGFGEVSINTCGTGSDTLLAVYTGFTVTSLTPIASNDDACGFGSAVTFATPGGTIFRIAVDGFGDYVDFALSWSFRISPPQNVDLPTISGAAVIGSELQGSAGRWRNASGAFSVAWEACEPGLSNCAQIPVPFPNSFRLRVPHSAGGRQIRFVVTASGVGGQTTVPSAPTATVPFGSPLNLTPPSIGGPIAPVGKTLIVDEGEWDLGNAPRLNTTFLWQRCNREGVNCRNLRAAGPERTYRVAAADRGSSIQVVVTVVSAGGATSETSLPVDVLRPPCRVPRLVGRTLKTARRTLARAKCRLGSVRRTWSARKVGVIVAQRPRAGTRLRAGARVNVVLSKGRRR